MLLPGVYGEGDDDEPWPTGTSSRHFAQRVASRGVDEGIGRGVRSRLAVPEDVGALTVLMDRSNRGAAARLSRRGADRIEPGDRASTHSSSTMGPFLVESGADIAGCGGWSRRATLYGGNHTPGRDSQLLDPSVDPARVRAMYTNPAYARRGVGRLILSLCEAAAAAEGFRSSSLCPLSPASLSMRRTGSGSSDLRTQPEGRLCRLSGWRSRSSQACSAERLLYRVDLRSSRTFREIHAACGSVLSLGSAVNVYRGSAVTGPTPRLVQLRAS